MMVLSFGTRRSRSGLSCTTPSSLPGHRRGASSSQVNPLTWSNQVGVDSLGRCLLGGESLTYTREFSGAFVHQQQSTNGALAHAILTWARDLPVRAASSRLCSTTSSPSAVRATSI